MCTDTCDGIFLALEILSARSTHGGTASVMYGTMRRSTVAPTAGRSAAASINAHGPLAGSPARPGPADFCCSWQASGRSQAAAKIGRGSGEELGTACWPSLPTVGLKCRACSGFFNVTS
jgi:hypothetical protein